jgi:hypothetical protein
MDKTSIILVHGALFEIKEKLVAQGIIAEASLTLYAKQNVRPQQIYLSKSAHVSAIMALAKDMENALGIRARHGTFDPLASMRTLQQGR